MGNLIVTLASIPLPLITDKVIIPFLYHPYRRGGIPWQPPGYLGLTFFTGLINISILIVLAMLSNSTSALRECNKIDLWISLKRSSWVVVGYLLGNVVAFAAPIIKSPLISVLMWMPYAGYIANGLITAGFVLIFGALGNARTRDDICTPTPPPTP